MRGGTGGLFVAAAITAAFVLFFPLAAVGQMASLAFLIVYGTVSAGHLALFVLLLGYTIDTGPASTGVTLIAVLVLSFVFEIVYRKRTGRSLALTAPPPAVRSSRLLGPVIPMVDGRALRLAEEEAAKAKKQPKR